MDINIKEIAWIGLNDEQQEGNFLWIEDGMLNNGYFNWDKGIPPSSHTGRNSVRIRFDQFGNGWQQAKSGLTNSVIICTRR